MSDPETTDDTCMCGMPMGSGGWECRHGGCQPMATRDMPTVEEVADLIRRCEDDGASKERSRIIAWLRRCAEMPGGNPDWRGIYLSAAEAIKRGEHAI